MYPNPIILGYELQWYPFFHWLGVGLAVLFGLWYYRHKMTTIIPLRHSVVWFVLLLLIAMLGSRIVGMFDYYIVMKAFPPISIIWKSPNYGHFSWNGTLLFFIVLFPLVAKIFKLPYFWDYFDLVAVCLCFLTIFAKQGCQFSGDGCYGIPTNLPWGMYYIDGTVPSWLPVHPTPIYDSLFHIGLLGFLLWHTSKKQFSGQIAMTYFISCSVFYMLLEFIRANPKIIGNIGIAHITHTIIFLVALVWYQSLRQKTREK